MVEAVKKSVSIKKDTPEKFQGVWKAVLEGAGRTAEFQKSTILYLGRKDAGKATLIRSMQKMGCGSRQLTPMEIYGETHGVAGVDYAYMNVRAVDDADLGDSLSSTDIWILQIPDHSHLLSPLISPKHLKNLLVVICLDLSEPWTLKSQLRHWLDFASTFVSDLMKGLPAEEQNVLRARLSKYIEGYRSKVEGKAADEGVAEDTTLKVNLGVPIVVCVCKSDFASNLDTRNYPGRADVVLAHLRNLCLPYGAAIIYCCTKSASSARNVDLLYKFMVHRMYGFKFQQPAVLSPPDSIFVPSGWDTEAEIKEFAAKTVAEGLETPLETLLPPPVDSRAVANEMQNVVDVTTMNDFLEALLARDPSLAFKDKAGSPAAARSANPPVGKRESTRESARESTRESAKESPPVTKKSSRSSAPSGDAEGGRASTSKRNTAGSAGGAAAAAGGAGGDSESLRSFFQTLLTKPGQANPGQANVRQSSPRPDGEEKPSKEESPKKSKRSSAAE